jgi:hypothetical protein
VGVSSSSQDTQKAGADTTAAPQSGINPKVSLFSRLTNNKDQASAQARTVRQTGEVLNQARELVSKLKQQLGMVKNYPPFPPGNEARVQYLKSIEGLRKELEAVSVPPMQDGQQVVIYPKSDKYAALDAGTASNTDLMALNATLDQTQANIQHAQAGVQGQAQKIWSSSDILPAAPDITPTAGVAASVVVSEQLRTTQLPLTTNSASLALVGR